MSVYTILFLSLLPPHAGIQLPRYEEAQIMRQFQPASTITNASEQLLQSVNADQD